MTTYISAVQAAKQLGVTQRRIRQLCQAGELAGLKVTPRCWLVLATEVARRAAYRREGRHRWRPSVSEPEIVEDAPAGHVGIEERFAGDEAEGSEDASI